MSRAIQLYRLSVKCDACGEDWTTLVSADVDLEGAEGRRIIDDACAQHSAVCPVRGGAS